MPAVVTIIALLWCLGILGSEGLSQACAALALLLVLVRWRWRWRRPPEHLLPLFKAAFLFALWQGVSPVVARMSGVAESWPRSSRWTAALETLAPVTWASLVSLGLVWWLVALVLGLGWLASSAVGVYQHLKYWQHGMFPWSKAPSWRLHQNFGTPEAPRYGATGFLFHRLRFAHAAIAILGPALALFVAGRRPGRWAGQRASDARLSSEVGDTSDAHPAPEFGDTSDAHLAPEVGHTSDAPRPSEVRVTSRVRVISEVENASAPRISEGQRVFEAHLASEVWSASGAQRTSESQRISDVHRTPGVGDTSDAPRASEVRRASDDLASEDREASGAQRTSENPSTSINPRTSGKAESSAQPDSRQLPSRSPRFSWFEPAELSLRFFALILVAALFVITWTTFARAALLTAFLVSMAALSLRGWRQGARFLVAALVLMIAGAGMAAVFLPETTAAWPSRMLSGLQSLVEGDRAVALKTGVELVLRHPMLGVGFGNHQSAALHYGSDPLLTPLIALDSHNIWLTVWAETGLLGLILGLHFHWLLARTLYGRWRQGVWLAGGALLSWLGFQLLGLVHYLPFHSSVALTFAFVWGLGLGAPLPEASLSEDSDSSTSELSGGESAEQDEFDAKSREKELDAPSREQKLDARS